MKRMSLYLAAMLAALALTGCKSSPKETEPVTEPPTEAVTEAPTEPVTEAPTEPVTEAEDSMNKTRSLKGLVKASGTNSLTIQTERGKELTFDTTGADIQIANGIQTGNNVTVMYKGKVSGDDTSQAKVLMVVDLASGETPVTEGEPMTESAEADPNAGEGTLGGSIEDVNTDRIVVLADDGESYYFSLYGTNVKLVNGMIQDNYVTVQYNGDIYGPELVSALYVADTEVNGAESQRISGPSQEGEYTYINGVLSDCSLGSVTITTDDGEEMTFDISGATCSYSNGVAVGNYITLECDGQTEDGDTSGLKVLAVYDYGTKGSTDTTGEEGTADAGAADDGTADAGADAGAEDAAVMGEDAGEAA